MLTRRLGVSGPQGHPAEASRPARRTRLPGRAQQAGPYDKKTYETVAALGMGRWGKVHRSRTQCNILASDASSWIRCRRSSFDGGRIDRNRISVGDSFNSRRILGVGVH